MPQPIIGDIVHVHPYTKVADNGCHPAIVVLANDNGLVLTCFNEYGSTYRMLAKKGAEPGQWHWPAKEQPC